MNESQLNQSENENYQNQNRVEDENFGKCVATPLASEKLQDIQDLPSSLPMSDENLNVHSEEYKCKQRGGEWNDQRGICDDEPQAPPD